MILLVLTYFDPIGGPRIFLKAPDTFEGDLNFLPELMDLGKNESDFFEFEQDEFNSANLTFENRNPNARGGIDMLMISLVLYKEDIEPESFRDALNCFIRDFKKIPDLYIGMDKKKQYYCDEKCEEITNFFYDFWKDLPEETILIDRNIRILVIGFLNAGKTTIINNLKDNLFDYRQFKTNITAKKLYYNNLSMTTYDLPRIKEFGNLWKEYINNRDGYIFAIDVTDIDKFEVVTVELNKLAKRARRLSKPILVFLNKMDLNKFSEEEIINSLGLMQITYKKIKLFPTHIKDLRSLFEGFNWLANKILENILKDESW